MTTVVRGRWVVTGAGDDDPVIDDGAVAVDGGRIAAVGAWAELHTQYPDADILGSADAVVLPGLINAHHHSAGLSTLQEGGWDDLLEPWILAHARRRPRDGYLDVLLSAARQLRSGVTCVVDMHSDGGTADAFADRARRKLAAYDEAGLRVAFAIGLSTQSHIVAGAGEDARFVAALPPETRGHAETLMPAAGDIGEDAYFAIMDDLHAAHAGHPRIDLWFGPPGPQWVSDGFMQRIAERAAALDTGVQTHVDESLYEKLHGLRFYGQPTVCHLRDLGVLSPRFSIAHGVWLTETEIDVLAETGAALSRNPSSNLRLRAGIAPLNALLGNRVTVGLGMDGTTLNDDEDMFTEMRLAMRLHRAPLLGAPAPQPGRVFHMATGGGAALLRKATVLGRLSPGYAADIVVAGSARLTEPWLAPGVDARDLALMRLGAGDVETVLVGGEVVFRDGRPTRFDADAAARALAEQLSAAPDPEDGANLFAALKPHLEAWYRDWDIPDAAPYIHYNSKR